MNFQEAIELLVKVVDAAGAGIIVIAAAVATGQFLIRKIRPVKNLDAYREYRTTLGRGILLGLEFLVGADIIRTVAINPTFRSAGVLAVIVAIRTFLSMSIELEITGKWPWQQRQGEA